MPGAPFNSAGAAPPATDESGSCFQAARLLDCETSDLACNERRGAEVVPTKRFAIAKAPANYLVTKWLIARLTDIYAELAETAQRNCLAMLYFRIRA